jgi:hypothetical protein
MQYKTIQLEKIENKLRQYCAIHRIQFSWNCSVCSFKNKHYWDICEVCDSWRIFQKGEPTTYQVQKKPLFQAKSTH